MVLIPNTTGVESANTNVIGRCSSHARQGSEYLSNSATKRRAHWSLKTRWGMLPSNIARKQKKITSMGHLFFKARTSVLSLTA